MSRVREILGSIAERLLVRRRTYAVFADAPDRQRAEQDPLIDAWDADRPPPAEVRRLFRRYAGLRGEFVMLGRLRRAGAIMLSAVESGDLVGYGWLQRWPSVRREFWWLAPDGICLGPYWTHPERRGQGIYGRFLRHSLFECRERFPKLRLYIWARTGNAASIRGIEAAGFEFLGFHSVALYTNGLIRRHDVATPPR